MRAKFKRSGHAARRKRRVCSDNGYGSTIQPSIHGAFAVSEIMYIWVVSNTCTRTVVCEGNGRSERDFSEVNFFLYNRFNPVVALGKDRNHPDTLASCFSQCIFGEA